MENGLDKMIRWLQDIQTIPLMIPSDMAGYYSALRDCLSKAKSIQNEYLTDDIVEMRNSLIKSYKRHK